MRQFYESKARLAIDYLLNRLSGKIEKPLEEEISITPKLVIRNSTRVLNF
jgi:DNA-binding LacI/PurR family transcriptional regulator